MKRDAVLAAFRHQKGPHLPYQVEMTREIKTRLCSRVGVAELDFGSWVGNYCEKVDIGETGVLNARGMYTDDFGVAWDRSGLDKDIGTIHNPILGEPVLGAYKFPVADTERARALLKAEANIPAGRAVFAKIGTTLFERAWSLTGFENFLMYLAVEQDFAREVLRNVCDHRLALVEAVLDLPFQGFYFGDDYGQQTGTLFSPETFRTVIKDELARLFAPVRAAGKLVVLHSCGNILTFLDDLVEIGLDGYQTVQPEVYDFGDLKRRYGSALTFWGGISTQTTLPFGSTDDVRKAVAQAAATLGAGGGYIAGPTHRITSDTPLQNVLALVEALVEQA